ncbi:MAG: type II toxin-antitoxin system PemK/MazF family toxin [Patescibacteria group bacterium]
MDGFSPIKNYPFEVTIDHSRVHGVILADQVRSLAWRKRNMRFITKIDRRIFTEVALGIISLITDKEGPVA